MSYQPPPEQPGGPPPGPPAGEPPQGGYTPPPPGGYTPPPSEGTPTTNIPPQGGQGGYTPPPSGGYTPPPPGGYTPPPAGGYGAPPPPPPPTGGGIGSMGGSGQVDFQDLMQSYMGALTSPNTTFYESQIPKANLIKLLIGLGIVIVVDVITNLIGAGAAAAQWASLTQQFGGRGVGVDPSSFAMGGGIAGALLSIVLTPIMFFIGSGIIYGLAKMLGGQGTDFMVHSYLLSLSYVPLGVVASVLGLIPGIGFLVFIAAVIYRQYSQGKSLEASQRMAAGRAQMAAYIPVGIVILLICLCIGVAALGLMAAIGGATR